MISDDATTQNYIETVMNQDEAVDFLTEVLNSYDLLSVFLRSSKSVS